MARIDFAFGAQDKLTQACHTTLRQYLAGQRVVIYCPDAQRLANFDRLLWSIEDTAFVPHAKSDDSRAAATPIVMVQHHLEASLAQLKSHAWLLNLADDCPPSLGHIVRVLEIVADDEADKQAARARWMSYKAQGHELKAHHLGT